MRLNRSRLLLSILTLVLAALIAGGCAMRPKGVSPSDRTSATPSPATPVPTQAVYHTVEYRFREETLSTETVLSGESASSPPAIENVRLIGWANKSGEAIDPTRIPIHEDTIYYASARPFLQRESAFLLPDEYGLIRPAAPLKAVEMAQGMRALLPDESWLRADLERWDAAPEELITTVDFHDALGQIFFPEELENVQDLFPETETIPRSRTAEILSRLLELPTDEILYYPDLSPSHPAVYDVSAVSAPGSLTVEQLNDQTKDGFLWLDGYLYRPDENGYFMTDQEYDSLYFDSNGRYTSGNSELDDYVAAAIREFSAPEKTRLEDLHALYFHVKNDFEYLRRNYYASGAVGWDQEEALTIFRTNKGNCYCYAGAFCALARGMGYNAVTYSGTIGIQEQPHAWTEITMEDGIYICDPEIEMNYWVWLKEYTDNFMMRREKSAGWNYIAMGRTVEYE